MTALLYAIVAASSVVAIPAGGQGLVQHPMKRTTYEKPGQYTVKSLEFPNLKDSSRNDRRVPLKVYFPQQGSNFPLVVMSHGGAGTWEANIYQVEHLASHGYVVVSIQHVFSDVERVRYYMSAAGGGMGFLKAVHRISSDPKSVLERPRDVSFSIDQAIVWNGEHEKLRHKINTAKIAVMGHSYGAYTTLVACGARPILDHLNPRVGAGRGLAGDLSDGRVTFGFAMSPQGPGGTFFGRESYKTINRPLVCLSGSKDSQMSSSGGVLPASARRVVFGLLPPGRKYFFWLANADHLSFSDNKASALFPSASRPDAQRISKALMVMFSDYFLKGRQDALDGLTNGYLKSLTGKVVTRVELLEK